VTQPYFQLLADTHYEREKDNHTACRCSPKAANKKRLLMMALPIIVAVFTLRPGA
jgi:hypothetical protein